MENERYTSLLKRSGKQLYIPDMLLEVADIKVGDYLEITIRKIEPATKRAE